MTDALEEQVLEEPEQRKHNKRYLYSGMVWTALFIVLFFFPRNPANSTTTVMDMTALSVITAAAGTVCSFALFLLRRDEL